MFETASSGPDNSKPAQSVPLFGPTPVQSSFFGAACQSKPTVSSSTFSFGTVPIMTTNNSAPTGTPSLFGSTNSGFSFGTPLHFGVSQQKKK